MLCLSLPLCTGVGGGGQVHVIVVRGVTDGKKNQTISLCPAVLYQFC